jgi:uncharacterized protein YijF (DUF1287 family)
VSLYAPPSTRPSRRLILGGAIGVATVGLAGCSGPLTIEAATGTAARLAWAAQKQLGVTKGYDKGYHALAYPGGDVPRKTGVCCDVVIRAARDGLDLDLQKLVHEDMAEAFDAYPSKARWGLKKPDANIDHRRVPNLEAFFRRQGAEVWAAGTPKGAAFARPLQVGDILTWRNRDGGPHIGLVSRAGNHPMIIHNFGLGVMQHGLWLMATSRAAGHYRWPVVA